MKFSTLSHILVATMCLILLSFSGQAVAAPAKNLDKTCYKGLESYVNGDFVMAKKLFEKVAKKNEACSQFQLGMMYFYGHGLKKNVKKAKYWLNKASKNGFSKAADQLKQI